MNELFIYVDKVDCQPGDRVETFVSSDEPGEATISLVKPRASGDEDAINIEYEMVQDVEALHVTTHFQRTYNGSFGVVSGVFCPASTAFTLAAYVWPTRVSGDSQTIMSWQPECGGAVELVKDCDGRLSATRLLRDGRLLTATIDGMLNERQWYLVTATLGSDGTLTVRQVPVGTTDPNDVAKEASSSDLPVENGPDGPGRLVIAASTILAAPDGQPRVKLSFDGKIEAPALFSDHFTLDELRAVDPLDDAWAATAFAAWRFDSEFSTDRFLSLVAGQPDGALYNAPTRGMTGRNWSGRNLDFRYAPAEYGAVHFHSDDLEDAAWAPTGEIELPAGLPSGVYCVRVRGASVEDHVPIFVSPAAGARSADVLFLAPTFSYIAYANNRLDDEFDYSGGVLTDLVVRTSRRDQQILHHPEFGMSLYDRHLDGSGSCLSTTLRPIPNLRCDYVNSLQSAPRHFPADLVWPSWFANEGISFDVLSDHGLHERGVDALEGYRLIVTGSHPEYWSGDMLDAMESHLGAGGSLAYTGGNGFYWVTSASTDRPHLLEVRRGQQGIRTWEGEPGETTSTQSLEPGGLWRLRGRAPNKLVGVGMAAQGWDTSTPGFRKTEHAADERVADLFDGVTEDVIGDFGLVMGGAAGDEIDRFDLRLGSPRHALVIARSDPHSNYYLSAVEEITVPTPNIHGGNNPNVHADIVFFETTGGGFVVSTSAISWTGSVAYRNFRNNASTFMKNVVRKALRQKGST